MGQHKKNTDSLIKSRSPKDVKQREPHLQQYLFHLNACYNYRLPNKVRKGYYMQPTMSTPNVQQTTGIATPQKSLMESLSRKQSFAPKAEIDQASLSDSMASSSPSPTNKGNQKDGIGLLFSSKQSSTALQNDTRQKFLSPIAETSVGQPSNEASKMPVMITAPRLSTKKNSLPDIGSNNQQGRGAVHFQDIVTEEAESYPKPRNLKEALKMKAEREARDKEPKRCRNIFDLPSALSLKSAEGVNLNTCNESLLKQPTMQKVVIRDQLLVLGNKFFTIKSQLTDEGFQDMVFLL